MRGSRPLALGMVALLTLTACTQGEGPRVERTREVDSFNRIEAGAGIQVQVTIGSPGPLVVHAQENIQDKVTTGVREGTLRIEANDDFTVADPVVVEVTTPNLVAVMLSGGASVEVSGLDTDAIEVSLSGGARATITGTAQQVTLTAKGGSVASLAGLATVTATVNMEGGARTRPSAASTIAWRRRGSRRESHAGCGCRYG